MRSVGMNFFLRILLYQEQHQWSPILHLIVSLWWNRLISVISFDIGIPQLYFLIFLILKPSWASVSLAFSLPASCASSSHTVMLSFWGLHWVPSLTLHPGNSHCIFKISCRYLWTCDFISSLLESPHNVCASLSWVFWGLRYHLRKPWRWEQGELGKGTVHCTERPLAADENLSMLVQGCRACLSSETDLLSQDLCPGCASKLPALGLYPLQKVHGLSSDLLPHSSPEELREELGLEASCLHASNDEARSCRIELAEK